MSRQLRSRWTPRLESLDARLCPSVTVQANGPQLKIDGNNAADVVSIVDNGQGQVAVTAGGKTSTFTGISEIQVQTGGGNDSVDYRLTGSTRSRTKVDINLGDGDDTASVQASGIRLGTDAELKVSGGRGNDAITANYAVEVDGRFRFELVGNEGDDTISSTLALAAGSTGAVETRVQGNDGNDRLTLNVTGRAGSLQARLSGNDGFDRFAATANVRVDGVEAPL